MLDFITVINNVLEEKELSLNNLFNDNVISKNTFYKYKHRNPSLKTIIKIANYLEVSIDYMYDLTDINNFKPYSENQEGFYKNLIYQINNSQLSIRKFCSDLHYSKDNVLRYKKGVEPSLQTLLEIANYFSCTIDDLLIRK